MIMLLKNSTVLATPINGGYSWTTSSILGYCITCIEELVGKRNPDWTILGVEFVNDRPRVWYPGDRKHISIRIQDKYYYDFKMACCQISHETVHAIDPVGFPANYLEEGIATYMQFRIPQKIFAEATELHLRAIYPPGEHYNLAETLFKKLLEHPGGELEGFRRLREVRATNQKPLGKFDQHDIETIFNVSAEVAHDLGAPFESLTVPVP